MRLTELHQQLPSEAQPASLALIQERFSEYAERRRRKLNGGNLGALIFVVVVGGGLTYGVALIAVQTTGAWPWVLGAFAVLAGLFTLALSVVGMSTLYAPRKTDSDAKS